jgi:hypothetical protein
MTTFPTKAEDLTAEWLTALLKKQGLVASETVTDINYRTIGTGKLGSNVVFTITYSSHAVNAPTSLVGKFSARDESTRTMAGQQGAYYAEVSFYERFAQRTPMRLPRIYFSGISDDKLQCLLLMEDLSDYRVGSNLIGESYKHAQMALHQAARLASSFYGSADILNADFVVHAARDDGGALGQALLIEYWPMFLQRFGDALSPEAIAFGDYYVPRHAQFVTGRQSPYTLAHCDFRCENMLFSDTDMVTVDWQTPSVGGLLTDVAYFLGGSVDTDDRRRWERELILEYREQLHKKGLSISVEDCWQQYRRESMHGLLIMILGACFSQPDERSDHMFSTMIKRHLQHCLDLNAADFLQD